MNLSFAGDDTSRLQSKRIHLLSSKFRSIFFVSIFIAAVCCVIAASNLSSYAVQALESPRVLSQPSGEQFTATLHGDEWFNYTAAANGCLVVKGGDGYWYYGVAANNGLAKSNAKFKIDAKPANAQTVNDVKNLRNKKYADFEKTHGVPVPNRSFDFSQSSNIISGSPAAGTMALNGTQKVLVLLVSFKNISIVNTDSAWSNEFFGDTGKTLKTFYKEMSANNFYFAPATESKGTANDGVIRVTLTYNHPNTGEDINSKNQKIVIDAVTAADTYINFSLYDTDGNSIITASELHILTVVAGNDCSYGDSAPCIWPHSWTTDDYIYKDGKYIYGDYTQIAEKQGGHMTTMGVVAHELGHDIGLPDLYDTDYSSDGLGVYSLMASGSWGMASGEYEGASPTHMDAWCKIQLGFVTPMTVTAGSYSMNAVTNGGYNVLKIATADTNQYFLVENRQATGFDAGMYYYGISTGGIAIYHIDESVTTDNDNETHKLVDLEEANEAAYGGSQLDDDNASNLAYNNLYRTGTNTLFSAATTPKSALYNGTATNISIGVPGGYAGVMTVQINYSTVTFNSNGGTAVAAITQPAGTVIQKPADPVKTGYTFGGWYSNSGLTTPVTWPYTLGLTNVVFYARWTANNYTVRYDGNGSTGGSTIDSTHTYDVARNLTANGFTRTGYSFLGWSAVSSATTANYTNGQNVINLTPNPNAIITFYAVWSVNYYSITFDANGGTGGWGPVSLAYGSALSTPEVTRTGYTLTNWSPLIPATVPAADATYTAQWSVNQYSVTFDAAGGIPVPEITQNYQTPVNVPVTTRTGYTFTGWLPECPTVMPAADTHCTAQWSINSYNLTFNANGGTGGTGPVPTVYQTAIYPPEVTRENYTFSGWSPSVPANMPAADVTYTAIWTADSYNLTFDANGGTGGWGPVLTAYGSHLAAPSVTRDNYTFTGWLPAVPETMPAFELTCVAQWAVNQYTVSFDSAGGTAVADITQDYSTAITAPADPVREGYAFDGWQPAVPETMPAQNSVCVAQWIPNNYFITFDANSGAGSTGPDSMEFGATLSAPAVTREGYTFDHWCPTVPDTVLAANTVYIAQWVINQYTVSFDSAGGTVIADITQDYATAITAPADPDREGYTFDGWQPAVPENIPAGNIVCVAQWKACIYTISFDVNGASGTVPSTQSGPCGTAVQLPLQGDMAKPFYTFKGWALSPDATAPVTDCMVEYADITLYAVWERIPVSLEAHRDSTTIIDDATGLIFGLSTGMSADTFESDFVTTAGDCRLLYSSENQKIGTGVKVTLVDNVTGNVISEYMILIFGDVNGDGNIDSADAGLMTDYENFVLDWDPTSDAAYLAAADLNGDGNVDSADAGIAVDVENFAVVIDQTTGLAMPA